MPACWRGGAERGSCHAGFPVPAGNSLPPIPISQTLPQRASLQVEGLREKIAPISVDVVLASCGRRRRRRQIEQWSPICRPGRRDLA